MYFDFEDYRPDIAPVGRAISWREGVLLSIIWHLLVIILIITGPKWLPDMDAAARARALALAQQQPPREPTRFVFVQPRRDLIAPKPPNRGEASDKDRLLRNPERVPNPKNALPFSRGNTPERVEAERRAAARGQGPAPDPAAGQPTPSTSAANTAEPPKLTESESALQMPAPTKPAPPQNGNNGRAPTAGGSLGAALQNLQRYIQRDQFENPQGGGQFGPEIQFDTKGVEFGPWIRRFVAQVKRNWLIPYAAMSMKGHVVITFNVHKDGSITDLTVVGPCPVDAFNNAAFGALTASNPTQPLPPEYPSERAFFTVTFFYNEQPQ